MRDLVDETAAKKGRHSCSTSASSSSKAFGILEWYRRPVSASVGALARFQAFPAWSKLVRLIALCVPPSAAAGRVISLLKLALSDEKFSSLADCVETAMKLRVNGRWV